MSQEKIIRENLKLWEQFAASYADIMVNAMEQTLKQSELVSRQVETVRRQSLQAWNMAQAPAQRELLRTVETLQEQVTALTDRVGELEQSLSKDKDD